MIAAQDQVDIGGDLLLRRSKPNQLIRLVANLCSTLSTNRANFSLPPLFSQLSKPFCPLFSGRLLAPKTLYLSAFDP